MSSHNPESLTYTEKLPELNPVNVYVCAKLIALSPLDQRYVNGGLPVSPVTNILPLPAVDTQFASFTTNKP